MGIYIKNMNIPKTCGDCPCMDMEQDCCGITFDNVSALQISMQDNCPLVEVPPHGRLIDADALKDNWTHKDLDLFSQGWGWLRDLNQAPTVIPAEEGET